MTEAAATSAAGRHLAGPEGPSGPPWLLVSGDMARAKHHVDLVNSQEDGENDEHVALSWALDGLIG